MGLEMKKLKCMKKLGKKINPKEVEYLFTIGPLAKHIAKTAGINFDKDKIISCNNKTQLVEKLKKSHQA